MRGLTLALAALLCAAAVADAQRVRRMAQQVAIDVKDARQQLLVQSIADSMAQMAYDDNRNITRTDPPAGAVSAAAATAAKPPVPDATPAEVAKAVAAVIVAAAGEAEARGSLGDPKVFKYTDGSGRVALYRMPAKDKKLMGTCIFIHGCKHDPYSWFYFNDAKCKLCTGLPEEVAHTKQCLARGYAVLALMSLNREYRSRCFASSGDQNDQPSAGAVVKAWAKKTGMSKKPMYMFGVSSGASFAIKFPATMKIQGVISEVNMPDVDAWGLVDSKGKFKVPFPPTVYYKMQQDKDTAKQIDKALLVFEKNKVPAVSIDVPMRPITDDFFSNRSVYLTPDKSAELAFWLKRINVLDKENMIKYDVRLKTGWTKKLPYYIKWIKKGDKYFNLVSDESQIWQEMNLAWAWHEIVSDYVRPTLEWLEKKGKADMPALLAKYDLYGNIACLTEKKEGC